jgi:IS1 family transposase
MYARKKKITINDPHEYGDCWTYTSIKRNSGFFLSFACGKRTHDTCKKMLEKLFGVMDLPFPDSKIFFSTDGLEQYEKIIKELYSESCIAYGRIIKSNKENSLIRAKIEVVFGNMNGHRISTSVIEGYNNKMRHKITQFGRKTCAFSKTIESHIGKINVFQFANNFMDLKREKWEHGGMKMRTPAIIEGITEHIWTWREFLEYPAIRL